MSLCGNRESGKCFSFQTQISALPLPVVICSHLIILSVKRTTKQQIHVLGKLGSRGSDLGLFFLFSINKWWKGDKGDWNTDDKISTVEKKKTHTHTYLSPTSVIHPSVLLYLTLGKVFVRFQGTLTLSVIYIYVQYLQTEDSINTLRSFYRPSFPFMLYVHQCVLLCSVTYHCRSSHLHWHEPNKHQRWQVSACDHLILCKETWLPLDFVTERYNDDILLREMSIHIISVSAGISWYLTNKTTILHHFITYNSFWYAVIAAGNQ